MSVNSVLVIEKNIDRCDMLSTLVEFVNCKPIVISDSTLWQDQVPSMDDVIMAIVGDCGGLQQTKQLLRELVNHQVRIPVFTLELPETNLTDFPGIIGSLRFPLKYPQLSNAIQQASVFRSGTNEPQSTTRILFRSLVGNSKAIKRVKRMIEQVADSDANVLILGESGVGKEVVARNLHYFSSRTDKPFVPVNCGAIPAELLESELFGHEKGAFTGAISARKGRFEMAEGGTLFLDEIGDMPLPMQVKLLRVLQERTFERVGSNKIQMADVRVIAATHRNLENHISDGQFREDLFYRLNVFPIDMPSLRERPEDIPLLVGELVKRIEHENRGSVSLTHQAMMSLCRYPWPGNVRELANVIQRLVILFPYGTVDFDDLPEKYQVEDNEEVPEEVAAAVYSETAMSNENYTADRVVAKPPIVNEQRETVEQAEEESHLSEIQASNSLPNDGLDLKEHLANIELLMIKQALNETQGVVAHAANKLKMRRTTLVEKMRKYGIQREDD